MKKKILGITMIAVIALAAGWNLSQEQNEVTLSDITLGNVDALARFETLCPNGCLTTIGTCNCRGTHEYKEAEW